MRVLITGSGGQVGLEMIRFMREKGWEVHASDVVDRPASVDPDVPWHILDVTDGVQLVGSRLGRSLWSLARERVVDCSICGKPHVHHEPSADYRSLEIASEPLTDEPGWKGVPDGTVFAVDPDFRLRFMTLDT